ncbi:MAG: type II toxin-antitoxin system VapC family toxin [Bacteriovoracia bacterium]
MKEKKLLDSSVWIEIFRKGPLSSLCKKELNSSSNILVPTLVIYEVYRKIAQTLSEDVALSAIALLSQHTVVDLNRDIALLAADISISHKLGMADSMILAHAKESHAKLISLDNDFSSISDAKVLRA